MAKVPLKAVLRELERRDILFSADHFWKARYATQQLETILSGYLKVAQAAGDRKAYSDLKKAQKMLIGIIRIIPVISNL